MNASDFIHIHYFNANEIKATGADLSGIDYDLIHCLDRVRSLVGKPIHLIYNGMNSGKHSSSQHPAGRAVDFYIDSLTHKEAVKVVMHGASVGFKGLGAYHNGSNYSFHFDLRKDLATWSGIKKSRNESWTYGDLTFNIE